MTDNLNHNLQNNIKNDNSATLSGSAARFDTNASNGYYEPMSAPEEAYKAKKKKREKPLVMFGWLCIAFLVASFSYFAITTTSVDTSEAAKEALRDATSTTLPIGTVLLSDDETVDQGDHTITHNISGQDSTNIWVWDFAAEDGDYVEVLVNGVPVGPAFMIKHKPVMIPVSLPGLVGQVQVKGVRDGGGGITYAVHIEFANKTFFNSAPVGKSNTYTWAIGQ